MNTFKDKFLYYGKDVLLNVSYLVVCSLIGFILMFAAVDNTIEGYICSILSALNIFMYVVVVRNSYVKTGEDAMRQRNANDMDRRLMLETRVYKEIDKVREYRPIKVWFFVIPLIAPLVILTIISLFILMFGGNPAGVDLAIKVIYGFVYAFFYGISKSTSVYFALLALIFVVGPVFLGYYTGVNRVRAEYAQVERLKKKVDGE